MVKHFHLKSSLLTSISSRKLTRWDANTERLLQQEIPVTDITNLHNKTISFTPWNLSILMAEEEIDKPFCLVGEELSCFYSGSSSTVLCFMLKDTYFQTGAYKPMVTERAAGCYQYPLPSLKEETNFLLGEGGIVDSSVKQAR